MVRRSRLILLFLAACALFPSASRAEAPVFAILQGGSTIKFHVNASVALDGTFDKWTAMLTFASPDVTTGVLDLEIEAASVDTGNGIKNSKLKSEDFFSVDKNPIISFHSTSVAQTGPNSFQVQGTFTIRGVSKTEPLTLTVSGQDTNQGAVQGMMAFDRKNYGMDSGIPFIRIADRVEVTINLRVRQTGGPALIYKP